MELSLKGLTNQDAYKKAGISLPEYDINAVREHTKECPEWVHFGVGNIFRIFMGSIADDLIAKGELKTGITCVEAFDYEVVDKIYDAYDNLVLAVTLQANGGIKKRVLGSLAEAIKAKSEDLTSWNRLKEIFTNENLQLASFTITEKGYALKGADGTFFPFIQKDLEAGPTRPVSCMAVVCAMLFERFKKNGAKLSVVSMDNCSHNGDKLKTAIVTIAKEWLSRGFVSQEFVEYVTDENRIAFPWTMIDKITPRPAQKVADELKADGMTGMDVVITDKKTYIAPFVNAEGPQYLVVEDRFPNGRPAFEKAGVYMTDRDTVNKVERMKVTTCLNPLHTALAVYGCLLDYTLIADEMKDAELKKLVEEIGLVEGMPVVTDPKILSPKAFVDEVLKVRIPNPFMPDTPQRIATDTSQKVGIRYGETIKSYVEEKGTAKELKAIPLALAGWLRYLLAVDDNLKEFSLSPDPMAEELRAKLDGIKVGDPSSYQGQLKEILSNANIFGCDLYKAGVGDKIEEYFIEEIKGAGAVRATLKKYL